MSTQTLSKSAKRTSVHSRSGKHHDPESRATAALFERLKRGTSIDTFKKAIIVAELRKKHNMDPEKIAKESGMSTAHVYNMFKLDEMPVKVRQYIKEGRIGATDALHLARKQPNDKTFLEEVESFIKEKESASPSNRLHTDAALIRKSHVLNGRLTGPERKKFSERLKTLIENFSPVKVSNSKLNMCTSMVSQIIGVA